MGVEGGKRRGGCKKLLRNHKTPNQVLRKATLNPETSQITPIIPRSSIKIHKQNKPSKKRN